MPPALVHIGVEILGPEDLVPREGLAQEVERIHVLPAGRTAGAVTHLPGRIAVQEE